MTWGYPYRWTQISDEFDVPNAAQKLEERDRDLESYLHSLGDCLAYFFYRYRWDQLWPMLHTDFDRAVQLLEERDRELEDRMNRSGGDRCSLEYTYRWPQIGRLLLNDPPRAFQCLEENDRVLELVLSVCSCEVPTS